MFSFELRSSTHPKIETSLSTAQRIFSVLNVWGLGDGVSDENILSAFSCKGGRRWSPLDRSLAQGGREQVETPERSKRGTGENEELNKRMESLRSEWITPREGDVITPGLKLAACISFRSLFTFRLDIWAPLYYSCLGVAPSLNGGVNEALCPDLREELKHHLRKTCQT